MTGQEGFIIFKKDKKVHIDYGMITLLAMAVLGSSFIVGQLLMEKPNWFWLMVGAILGIVIPNILNDKFQKAVNVALVIGTILLITVWRGIFRAGFLQMVNYAIALYNYQYGREVYYYKLPRGVNEELALIVFSTTLIFLIGSTFYYLVSEKKISWFISVIVLIVATVIFLRCTSAYVPSCMLIMAIPGSIMWSRSELYGEKKLAAFMAVFLCVGMIASIIYMTAFNYKVSPMAESMRMAVSNRIDAARYGEEDAPNGSLYEAASFEGSKTTRLIIGTNAPGIYYLKGFVGGEYDKGRWEEIPAKKYSQSNEGMFEWMKKKKFYPLAQSSQYLTMIDEKNGIQNKETQVVVSNKNANRKYLYTPYGMTSSTVEKLDGINRDMNVFQTDDSQNTMTYSVNYFDDSQALNLENTEWLKESEDDSINDFSMAQTEYRNFVYDNYLEVDEEIEEFLKAYAKDVNANGYIETTKSIRKWLADKKTAVVPEKEMSDDYILQFMGTFRQGNSSFYTSAAVMMYRYCGIPARYAEGYLVGIGSSDINKANEEDRLVLQNGREAAYQKIATGQNVHAWVEIYKDGLGWIPVEVTPGFYDELNKKQQTQINRDNLIEKITPKERKKAQRSDRSPRKKINFALIFTCILLVIISIFIICLVSILIIRLIKIHKRNKQLDDSDYIQAMHVLLPYLANIFDLANIDKASIPEEQLYIILEFRFRNEDISKEDYLIIYDYASQIKEEVYSSLNRTERLKAKYIKALY